MELRKNKKTKKNLEKNKTELDRFYMSDHEKFEKDENDFYYEEFDNLTVKTAKKLYSPSSKEVAKKKRVEYKKWQVIAAFGGTLVVSFLILFIIYIISSVDFSGITKINKEEGESIITLTRRYIQKSFKEEIHLLNNSEENKNDFKEEEDNKEEEKEDKEEKDIKKHKVGEIDVVILNAGAPSGYAGGMKKFLKESGYIKSTAGNYSKRDQEGIIIYYQFDYIIDAQSLALLLRDSDTYNEYNISVHKPEEDNKEKNQTDIVIVFGGISR